MNCIGLGNLDLEILARKLLKFVDGLSFNRTDETQPENVEKLNSIGRYKFSYLAGIASMSCISNLASSFL